jgi:outer membrane protein OmpA-like peptidoglycan-associated protein
MTRYLLYLLLLLAPWVGLAQSTNVTTAFHGNIRKADTYFEHFAYRNALHIYLHANEKDPANLHIRERIAECYFRLHDPVNAEKWFEGLVSEADIHPEAKFEYAEALSMNGKYSDSRFWFEEYLKHRPDDRLALEKVAFLKKIHWYQEDSLRFVVVGAPFNSDHSDYGAHYFHEGIVYASSRDMDVFIKHKPFDAVDEDESSLNLFYVERGPSGDWGEPVHFHQEHIKTFLHEGPMAFFSNDKRGAFTRTNLKNGRAIYDEAGRANLNIYFADVDELGSLSNITPFEYNNQGYSTAHPTFSSDGTVMFFSSTSPQGLGDSDIYYSTFENGKWTEPKNLGPTINTREDESFPFLANDSTLYFSSNGHGTLGGLDILVSYKKNGQWTKARNFGGPLNTRFDDFSLVSDSTGRVGFIASNRPGGLGLDDIYFFIANYYFLTGKVKELNKQGALPGATILIHDENGTLVDSVTTDDDGGFGIYLPFDKDYTLSAKKDGYESLEGVGFTTQGKPFGTDSLDVPLWKHNLFAKGRVLSNETEDLLPGATVVLHNFTDNKSDTLALDDRSEYRVLVLPNKKYRIEAQKKGYVTKGFDLNTTDLYDGELVNDIVLEEEFILKDSVFFDFDRHNLTSTAKRQLDRVAKELKDSPGVSVNIGAHADSRGTHEYNQALSDRRAQAVVNYLVSRGIIRSRIEATGFGEVFLVNECSDGVDCPEVKHSKNRRAEIKIQNEPVD